MNKLLVASLASSLALAAAGTCLAQTTTTVTTKGDVLLMQQVHKEHQLDLPKRGQSMAQVLKQFGAPLQKLDTRGGDSAKHPPINRWVYAGYTVYFERNHVIHAVINPPPGNS
ncbi:MAG TPA: hypothetical protein VFN09_07145 [Rhodanobacteraceae bacterium]|nr:hypothetical protein [Rhodanobacteraceae bacterium]